MLPFWAVFALAGCDKETVVQDHELPKAISTFIATHFPANRILQSVKDRDGLELTYDILLEGNIKLEFNSKHQIIDIESGDKLPDAVVPSKISEYISANYPGKYITGWELDDKHQQVTLNDGVELKFDMSGIFLRIDL